MKVRRRAGIRCDTDGGERSIMKYGRIIVFVGSRFGSFDGRKRRQPESIFAELGWSRIVITNFERIWTTLIG